MSDLEDDARVNDLIDEEEEDYDEPRKDKHRPAYADEEDEEDEEEEE